MGATSAAALLSLGRHGSVALGWLAGVVALALTTAVVDDLLLRIELGFVIGCLAAAVVLTWLLRQASAQPAPLAAAQG